MARYALPFLCLVGLATTAVFAANQDPTIYVQSGDNLKLGDARDDEQSDIVSCVLTLSNGTKVNLYPKSQSTQTDSRYRLNNYQKCETSIWRLSENETGVWTLETTIKKQRSTKVEVKRRSYNVEVRKKYQEKAAIPAETVWVYPDQLVSVRFSDAFTNLKSCKLLNPKKIEYDIGSGSAEHIQKLGHCGFKMVAKKEYAGTWTLIADADNNTAFYTEMQVIVKDPNDLNPHDLDLDFKNGEDAFISLKFENQKPKMCYIEDPHGVKYPIQSGGCSKELGRATKYHEGQWKAHYGFDGMEKLVERKINIRVREEKPTLKSGVVHSSNGDINLICQVRTGSWKYCSFVRPDGEILHMTMGVGNEKYEYYGNGTYEFKSHVLDHESTIDCGVTIHKPDAKDFGSWRCLVSTAYRTGVVGTVLKVAPPGKSALVPESITEAKDVYVRRGDSYTIKCKTDEVLSYCWLRSPNGTVHNVVQIDRPKAPALKYEGEGFELGDCSALVENANDTHSGQWTCHMGVQNGPEVEAELSVVVTDTHLMAARETVVLESHDETDLICRPLPGSTEVIEACRWVNPLGHGINVERDGRYDTETGSTRCKLSIRVINYEEDVGNWSCYARFANSQDEEQSAQMVVVYRSGFAVGSVLTVALCTSALVTLSIAIFVLVVYKRRLSALRDMDEKIILEKPSKFP